jgi:hypothetical protein
METLYLPATALTPEVRLDPRQGRFSLRGESYPEHVLAFYAPILQRLQEVLETAGPARFQVQMHITYFNSASAKAIHRILRLLDQAAEHGRGVQLLWHFDEEDDMARDLGRDIREDFQHLEVVEVALANAS